MKFIINTTNLQSGGALQVAINLLREWQSATTHSFHVLLSPQMAAMIEKQKFTENFIFHAFKCNPTKSILSFITFKRTIKLLEQKIDADAVLTVFGPALWTPKKPHLVGFANGYYLFDDSSFIRYKICSNLFKRLKYYLRRFLLLGQLKKEATTFWVETEWAKQKLSNELKIDTKNITVIGNTYGSCFETEIAVQSFPRNTFKLLYVSAYYAHKNFEIIPRIIEILANEKIECRFLLTLPKKDFEVINRNTKKQEFLKNLGPIRPENLAKIYSEADAIFMPSLLETFSANYPEAMKANKPLLCSDFDFSRTICGDAALYFDANNPEDIANKIIEVINNKNLQKQLIVAGKEQLKTIETPASRAQKLLALLEKTSLTNKSNIQ